MPIVSLHNGGIKVFGERRYWMQVSLGVGLPVAHWPINHLLCYSGPPLLNISLSPYPTFCSIMLLRLKRIREDKSPHLPHWAVSVNPIALHSCTSSSFPLQSYFCSSSTQRHIGETVPAPSPSSSSSHCIYKQPSLPGTGVNVH